MGASVYPSRRYLLGLLVSFALIWLVLAWAPSYRHDWMLENVLTLLALPLFWYLARHYRFSRAAWHGVWLFMLLHSIGSHYTYAQVPYDSWARALTGHTISGLFGFSRNHYDRLVHALFGLLLMPLMTQWVRQCVSLPRRWRLLVPLAFMVSLSSFYELVEWGAAVGFGGDLGQAYLGTQGDNWDAEKDVALASLGALVSGLVIGVRARRSD